MTKEQVIENYRYCVEHGIKAEMKFIDKGEYSLNIKDYDEMIRFLQKEDICLYV